jgi:hypothetical protein
VEDKSTLSLVEGIPDDPIEETLNNGVPEFDSPAENEEVPATEEVFSPEELAMKAKIADQFAAMNDREILETILHNQLALRQGQELILETLGQMNAFASQFQGMKPSDILKKMMGK